MDFELVTKASDTLRLRPPVFAFNRILKTGFCKIVRSCLTVASCNQIGNTATLEECIFFVVFWIENFHKFNHLH